MSPEHRAAVNVYAFVCGYGGWSRHGRALTLALSRYREIAAHFWDARCVAATLPSEFGRMFENARDRNDNNVGLGIGPVERIGEIAGRKRLACVVWETTRIPRDKLRFIEELDEVWTPSSWGKSLLVENGVAEAEIRVIPEGVDTELFKPSPRPRGDEGKFRFLCVGKWAERKGIKDLLKAFCAAFGPHEQVELILHCVNPFDPLSTRLRDKETRAVAACRD